MSSARLSRSRRERSGRDRSAPLILLVGTPGTGKRPVGSYLEDEHGFVHVDLGDRAASERLLASGDAGLRAEIATLAQGGARRGLHLGRRLLPTSCARSGGCGRPASSAVWCDSDRGRRTPCALRRRRPRASLPVSRHVRVRRALPAGGGGRGRAAPAPRRGARPRRPRIPVPQLGRVCASALGAAGAALAGAAAVAMVVLAGIGGGDLGAAHPRRLPRSRGQHPASRAGAPAPRACS